MNALVQANRDTLARAAADIRVAISPEAPASGPGPAAAEAVNCVLAAFGITARSGPTDVRVRLDRHGVRYREIELEPGWQRHAEAVMLGSTRDGRTVALLPLRSGRGYRMVEPGVRDVKVDDAVAAGLSTHALVTYRPLPDGPMSRHTLTRYMLTGSRGDLVTVGFTGIVFGLLSLLVPISVGTLVPHLIAGGPGQLWWLALLLGVVAAAAGLTLYVRNAASLRLQVRVQARLEPAIWGRLMDHEVGFFRGFTTGELVQRANAIAAIRQALSEVVVGALLAAFFSLVSLAVLLGVAPMLGLAVLGAVIVLGAVLVLLGLRQERHESGVYEAYGEVYGMLYALLLGIDKIQVAGREVQALARWAAVFRRQKTADGAATRMQARLSAVAGSLQPLLIAAMLGAVAAFGLGGGLTALTVAAVAIGQIALAVGQLSSVATRAYAVGPLLRRLAPIVAEPARVGGSAEPGRLRGALTVDRVAFRYPGAADATLAGVSLHAEPGEMLAVVGRSGSGKSTLVRMLLGFEQPSAGEVRYDGRPLSELDIRLVRRQLGTVLQHSTLLRGSLYDNIVGPNTAAGEDAVWRAVELAGIAAELRRLPLGLATRINETGAGFSGGQVQRLLLARALLREPAVLLLDEATSALDNRTQRDVSDRIASLNCTRIVVAHRLSTVRRADRIVVLDAGRVVASGSFDELIDSSAEFRRLVGQTGQGDAL